MADEVNVLVRELSLSEGAMRQAPANLAVVEAEPGLLSRRDRGRLFVLVEAEGDRYRIEDVYAELVGAITTEYFHFKGSITGGLREGIGAANSVLFQENLDSTRELRRTAGTTAAVIQGEDLYVAQAGPSLVYLVHGGEIGHFPYRAPWLGDDVPEVEDANLAPLGIRKEIGVNFFHHRLEPDTVVCLASSKLASLTDREHVKAILEQGADRAVADLASLAGEDDLSALVLEVTAGEGEIEPAPRSVPESVDRGEGRPETVAPERPERASTPPQAEPQPEPQREPRARPREREAAPQGRRRSGEARGRAATARGRPLQGVQRALSRLDIAGLLRSAGAAILGLLAAVLSSLSVLLRRTLPDRTPAAEEETGRGRRRVLKALALLIPVLVAVVVAGVYWQTRGSQAARFEEFMVEAKQNREAAANRTDPVAVRDFLQNARENLDQALLLRPDDPEAQQLRREVSQELDRVNAVVRLDGVTALAAFEDGRPTRVAVRGQTAYVLDEGAGRILHYRLSENGKGLAEGQPKVVVTANEQMGDVVVGDLVDLTLLNASNLVQTNTLFAVDNRWRLLRHNPTEDATTALTVANTENWRQPVAFGTFDGNFYVLDPQLGQILKYRPTSAGYGEQPLKWLAAESEVDLTGAVDMAIDGFIYVLVADGTVMKLAQGQVQPFPQANIDKSLRDPTAIYATPETQSVYVADAGNERVVQFSPEGDFQRQFLPTDDGTFQDLKDVVVDEVKGLLYLLSGDQLLVTDLPRFNGDGE